MSSLPKEAILEYQEAFFQTYGERITYEEAQKQAFELLNIYRAVYRPIKKSWSYLIGGEING